MPARQRGQSLTPPLRTTSIKDREEPRRCDPQRRWVRSHSTRLDLGSGRPAVARDAIDPLRKSTMAST